MDSDFPHKVGLFMNELRRLKTIELDDIQRELTNIAYQQIAEEQLKKSWKHDELFKIVEFEKSANENYYNLKISFPILSDWYTDTDYSQYVHKAQRGLNKLRNKKFTFTSEDVELIKGAIKEMHQQFDGDWKMSAIAHTQSTGNCSNVCTLRFEESLTVTEEIEKMKANIEEKKKEMRDNIKQSIKLAKGGIENPEEMKLEEERLDQAKLKLKNYIARTARRIEYNENLIEEGYEKSRDQLQNKILLSVGFLEDQIAILNGIRYAGFLPDKLDDAYYSSYLPSIMPFNWDELVWRAGYFPSNGTTGQPLIEMPKQTKEYGDTMGLITYNRDPVVAILKFGEISYTYYTTSIKIPLNDIPLQNFVQHEADIRLRSADEVKDELIKEEEEELQKKQLTEKPTIMKKNPDCKPPSKKVEAIKIEQDVKCNDKECSPIQQYLIEHEKNPYKTKIWGAIINFLQKMEKENIEQWQGRYGGGFATYLYTKGAYDTTDIDYKIYPKKENPNHDDMMEIKEQLETYINTNKDELLKSINSDGNDYKKILTKWSTGLKESDQDKRDGVFKITLVGPGYGPNGGFYGETTVAYCDIGFWSDEDFINDALKEKGIVPPADPTFYSKYKIRVIHKDFLIQEKELFLENLKK